jgi:hypothetical protein
MQTATLDAATFPFARNVSRVRNRRLVALCCEQYGLAPSHALHRLRNDASLPGYLFCRRRLIRGPIGCATDQSFRAMVSGACM